jgi:hypothetical protein
MTEWIPSKNVEKIRSDDEFEEAFGLPLGFNSLKGYQSVSCLSTVISFFKSTISSSISLRRSCASSLR